MKMKFNLIENINKKLFFKEPNKNSGFVKQNS